MSGSRFAVGQRVELVMNYGDRMTGEQGTIVRAWAGDRDYLVEVKMDVAVGSRGHTMECYAHRLKVAPAKAPVARAPLPDAIYLVAQSSDRIFPRRSYDTILKSLMEEMGELSTEIAIAQGTKKRSPSADGVKGEAVDVFVVAVDMLRAAWGDELFTTAFTDKVKSKLAKWERA